MKTLYSFIFILCSFFAVSQAAYFEATPFDDSLSIPGQHNYGINLSFPGMTKSLLYVTVDTSNHITYYGNTISFSSLNRRFYAYKCYAINAQDITDTIGVAIMTPYSKNIFFQTQVGNTGTTNCDGQTSITIDTATNYYYPVNIFAAQDMNGQVYTINIGANTLSGLCPGKYVVFKLNPSSPGYIPELYTFYIGDYDLIHPSNSFSVTVDPYSPTTGSLCNGEASVLVTGASGGLLYAYDGAPYVSSNTITGLCEGYHSVMVASSTDTVGSYFIVNNLVNIINNPTPGGPIIDTIVYNVSNCSFNYGLPVDSASVLSAITIDSNSIFINWEIWQAGLPTYVSDTISYDYQVGTNMISLVIYCGNGKTMSVNTLHSMRFNDYVKIKSLPTAIKPVEALSATSVFPNPFSDKLYVSITDQSAKAELYDVLGQKVSSGKYKETNLKGIELSTMDVKPGCYFLQVFSENRVHVIKVVKP